MPRWTSFLLLIGAGFFLFEAVIHAWGLPVLEHDKIFLFTHDRYIALYALTMTAIMTLTATNTQKYKVLFGVIMANVFLGFLNAAWIARQGGYEVLFPAVTSVDQELSLLGVGAIIWYVLTLIFFFLEYGSLRRP